jgi:CubicO group peptidase (beta-lactamase class C family)
MNYNILSTAITQGLFPGFASVFFNHRVNEFVCRGTRHFNHVGVDARWVYQDTLYDIASLTKVLVFIGILRQMGFNRIGLRDPIAKYLPFEGKGGIQKMTIWHLLTCGLDFVLPEELQGSNLHLKDGKGKLLFFKHASLRGSLGEMFRYGNPSAFIAGKILERVHRSDLEKAIRELVLNPLGMHDTSFKMTLERLKRVAPTQVIGSSEWQYGVVQDPTTRSFLPERVGIAGLFSCIRDMERLAWFLATGLTPSGVELLPKLLWKEMVTNQLEGMVFSDGLHEYGLGIDKPGTNDGYVNDPLFCKDAVVMSGSSGPFIFACPSWRPGKKDPRPIGGVILCNSSRDIPDFKAKMRTVRREAVQAFIDSLR